MDPRRQTRWTSTRTVQSSAGCPFPSRTHMHLDATHLPERSLPNCNISCLCAMHPICKPAMSASCLSSFYIALPLLPGSQAPTGGSVRRAGDAALAQTDGNRAKDTSPRCHKPCSSTLRPSEVRKCIDTHQAVRARLTGCSLPLCLRACTGTISTSARLACIESGRKAQGEQEGDPQIAQSA